MAIEAIAYDMLSCSSLEARERLIDERIPSVLASIALLTSQNWLHRSKQAQILKKSLSSLGVQCEEKCWESETSWYQYDCVMICSPWGYEAEYIKYIKALKRIECDTLLLNPSAVIEGNIDKDKQLSILERYRLPHIFTEIVTCETLREMLLRDDPELISIQSFQKLSDSAEFVVKPTISANGNLTQLFSRTKRPNTIRSGDVLLNTVSAIAKEGKGLMIQPFLPCVDSGEYSLIFIGNTLSHIVLRFPGIFNNVRLPARVAPAPMQVIDLGIQVSSLPEYSNCLYMRVDIVLDTNEPKVLEIECNEPDLYFYTLEAEHMKRSAILLAKRMEELFK